jgi:xanthine dehydrogenase accessory factor
MIYTPLKKMMERRENFVLVILVEKLGSAPTPDDAMMVVSKDEIAGTVGGGKLEALVISEALKALELFRPVLLKYNLREGEETGLICGGNVSFVAIPILPDSYEIKIVKKILEQVEEKDKGVCVVISPESRGFGVISEKGDIEGLGWIPVDKRDTIIKQSIESLKKKEKTTLEIDTKIFLVPLMPVPRLVLFGAGHISKYLAEIASMSGFKVEVADDRPEYANRERFPGADTIHVKDFEKTLSEIKINQNTYVVIQTRSHELDEFILEKILQSHAGYIGLIGSRRKIFTIFSNLKKKGVDEKDIDRVIAPVGLDICSETPQEIAVSIMAQLIQKRRCS